MAAPEIRRDPDASPKRLGRYEILLEIASGGMASVYLGRATAMAGFERIVAIKCCHPHLRTDDEFVQMFLDEARLAARIHHPNVVATLDVGQEDSLYLVMEYIEGDRLLSLTRNAARAGGHVPAEVALRIMIDALNGLHAAHELEDGSGNPLRVVHRDVSPQNILVGVDGTTRVTDFGIARAEQRATVTRQGEMKGKLGYMAPEQARCEAIDRRVDVFAAGVVLWEVLTSRRLFRGDSDLDTMQRVLGGAIAAPSSLAPGITPALDAALARALARNKEERFGTALEMIDALEACGIPVASPRVVARYLEGAIPDVLARRRALLKTSVDERGAPIDAARWDEEPISVSVVGARTRTLAPSEPDPLGRASPTAAASGASTNTRVAIAGVAVAVVVAIAMLGWFMHPGADGERTAQTQAIPETTTATPPSTPPTRPPETTGEAEPPPSAVIETAEAPTTRTDEPAVEPAPPPSTATPSIVPTGSTPTTAARGHRPVVSTVPGSTVTPPPPTSEAAPEPPREFRPEAI